MCSSTHRRSDVCCMHPYACSSAPGGLELQVNHEFMLLLTRLELLRECRETAATDTLARRLVEQPGVGRLLDTHLHQRAVAPQHEPDLDAALGARQAGLAAGRIAFDGIQVGPYAGDELGLDIGFRRRRGLRRLGLLRRRGL